MFVVVVLLFIDPLRLSPFFCIVAPSGRHVLHTSFLHKVSDLSKRTFPRSGTLLERCPRFSDAGVPYDLRILGVIGMLTGDPYD